MCAYNRLNGLYCSEHDWLLNKVLRDEWGFAGWSTEWVQQTIVYQVLRVVWI